MSATGTEWNTFEEELIELDTELQALGIVIEEGKARYIDEEESDF